MRCAASCNGLFLVHEGGHISTNIQDQKYEKNWKSKNDLKSRQRALNKELWAIYVFFNLKFDDCQKHES